MYLWRVAVETPESEAHDLGGLEVMEKGGRWSLPGTPLVYACTTVGVACLESLVHLAPGEMPANRYLVRIAVPPALWAARKRFEPQPGWDAEPPGSVSQRWGMDWVKSRASLLAAVPSVIAPEETNVLINPRHPEARQLSATRQRRFVFDLRLLARQRQSAGDSASPNPSPSPSPQPAGRKRAR